MKLDCQKSKFSLENDLTYLNCGAYSPTLKSGMEVGRKGMELKAISPYKLKPTDHFEGANRVRELFAELINVPDYQSVALIPAASYGMAIVAKNLHRLPNISTKKYIIQIQHEFPNNYYAFERVSTELNLEYQIIERPLESENRGKYWNERVLNAISVETAMVVMPHVHWIYGVRFDLERISKRCKEIGALLIIDATQSAGVYGLDVQTIQPDAVIVAGYKWLLGAYGLGVAYFGEFFEDGIPIEENWKNRQGSDNFSRLTAYEKEYRPKAQRYNYGEFSNFIQMPMLENSLSQILEWGVDSIQKYCEKITEKPLRELENLGCEIEDFDFRTSHLIGIGLPKNIDNQRFTEKLSTEKIIISNRGVAIRVSPYLYNIEDDLWKLVEVLKRS